MCALVERVVVSSVLVGALVEGVLVCCMSASVTLSALPCTSSAKFQRLLVAFSQSSSLPSARLLHVTYKVRRHTQKDAFALASSFLQRRRENTYFLFTIEVNDIRHPVYPQQY